MKTLLILATTLGFLAFSATANAHCNERRLVGYTSCGLPVFAYLEVTGHTRCGDPVFSWVTHYPSDCHCHSHRSGFGIEGHGWSFFFRR